MMIASQQRQRWLVCFVAVPIVVIMNSFVTTAFHSPPPPISPATGLKNEIYEWKEGQKIRYQVNGPKNGKPVVLIHGLFVNSDHWRKTLLSINDNDDNEYRIYAIDLWGCGYSSKPPRYSKEAQSINGENRFLVPQEEGGDTNDDTNNNNGQPIRNTKNGILKDIRLGTANGNADRIADVELLHPISSPYNFYTWSEQILDFCNDIVLKEMDNQNKITLVCNSIGTISTLQAVLDDIAKAKTNTNTNNNSNPSPLFDGVFIISPNFRELHSAEIPFSKVTMPFLRQIQYLLREKYGQSLFSKLAKPNIVKEILKEPYKVSTAVDDTLVDVLLTPLLTTGASDVVFDTLSYSAGPLPEQQLKHLCDEVSSQTNNDDNDDGTSLPIWICYGKDDPWTPSQRVENLKSFSKSIEFIQGLDGIGHCPHDEAPELVLPLLYQFLQRVTRTTKTTTPAC